MHDSMPEIGKWLRSVVKGHLQYYGVPLNASAEQLPLAYTWLWQRSLSRRSHKATSPGNV